MNSGGNVFLLCSSDFAYHHGCRDWIVLQSLSVCPHLSGRFESRGGKNHCISRHVCTMADAPGVHELNEYLPSSGMHGLRCFLPTFHLCFAENAWNTAVPKTVRRGGCPLGNNESCSSTLLIVLSHEVVGNVADGSRAGHGGHDDPIFQLDGAHGVRIQEFNIFHSVSPW